VDVIYHVDDMRFIFKISFLKMSRLIGAVQLFSYCFVSESCMKTREFAPNDIIIFQHIIKP